MSSAARIEERAARFLARKQEAQWSAQDQAELEAWLQESTLHEVAYLRMEHGWKKVDRMVVLKNPPYPNPTRVQPGAERTERNPPWALAASIAVAATALFVWRSGVFDGIGHPHYVTDIGGRQTVPLADGSRIELNTNTLVRTDVDDRERKVWVDRGEAYFDIAPDPQRPFVVYAGERRVTVLGTKFSVRRERDQVRVVVTEGKVRLENEQIMTGGDVVTTTKGSPARVEIGDAEKAARELSWRQGILTFNQTTLAEAAGEFNRYNRRQLVITDSAANVRIGGSFEATNLEAFVRLLERGFGLQTTVDEAAVHVSSRSDSP